MFATLRIFQASHTLPSVASTSLEAGRRDISWRFVDHAGGELINPLTPLRSFAGLQTRWLAYDSVFFGAGGASTVYSFCEQGFND